MAIIYCDDGGSNTSPYDTWAKAATTLSTAISAATPGTDVIYVGHDHQETSSTADIKFTGPSTVPSQVIVRVNTGTDTYDTTDATYNFVTTTGNYEVNFDGSFALYGIRIHSQEHISITANGDEIFYAQDCHCRVGDRDGLRVASAVLVNCTIDAQDDTSTRSDGVLTGALNVPYKTEIIGGSVSGSANSLTLSSCPVLHMFAVDLTGMPSGMALITNTSPRQAEFIKCRLPTNYVLFRSGTQDDYVSTTVKVYECDTDAGNKKYNVQAASAFGDLSTETTIIRTGGFVDKSTSQGCSWEVVTTADAAVDHPFITPWIYKQVSSTDTTAKVHINHDNQGSGTGNALQDDEIYLEAEVFGASGNTGGTIVSNKIANPLATAADHSTNSENWGASAKDDKQELSVTISPAVDGMARARVCVAKASATVYIDPVLELS